MPRYKLTLEYDGTGLLGWQWQEDGPTVQEYLQGAIYDFCQEEPVIHCSGRTDAGVHAYGQCVHIDLEKPRKPFTIMQAINHHLLPHAIAVVKAEEVDEGFHARFSAKARHYQYRIVNRRARLALDTGRAWQIPEALDHEAMHQAAQLLTGTHDFSSFRDSDCQAKSPVKTLDRLDVIREGEEIYIRASSRSFLHHQVRILTGSLVAIGKGKWTENNLISALKAKNRCAGGMTAPACGLYFVRVDY